MQDRRAQPLRALVLTAGLGTRLRPLTDVRAKAAMPVNGKPLIHRVIEWLASQGIRDLVLNLHHKPDSIAALVGDGSDLGVRVRYSWEQPVLGSAGGPRHALPLLAEGGRGTVLLVNGDTLTDVSIREVLEAHVRSGALVTMAVIQNDRPDKYGGVVVGEDGSVSSFTRAGSSEPSCHFIGVQVASAEVFEPLPDGVPAESVGSIYPALIARRPGSIRAFVTDASFRDIGTPRDLHETSLALAAVEGASSTGARATIAPSACLTRTALWDDVTVGRAAALTDCIVADAVRIPDGLQLNGCAVVPSTGGPLRPNEELMGGLIIRKL